MAPSSSQQAAQAWKLCIRFTPILKHGNYVFAGHGTSGQRPSAGTCPTTGLSGPRTGNRAVRGCATHHATGAQAQYTFEAMANAVQCCLGSVDYWCDYQKRLEATLSVPAVVITLGLLPDKPPTPSVPLLMKDTPCRTQAKQSGPSESSGCQGPQVLPHHALADSPIKTGMPRCRALTAPTLNCVRQHGSQEQTHSCQPDPLASLATSSYPIPPLVR